MGDEKRSSIYKGGLPYGPDIKRLDDAFPLPEEGQLISYPEIESILNMSHQEHRFQSVVRSWRRQLWKTRNIDSDAIPGIGIKILPPDERLKSREKQVLHTMRQSRRTRERYASIPRERLNDEGQHRYDHTMMLTGRIQAAIDDVRKQMRIDIAPVKSLPKPKLVKHG